MVLIILITQLTYGILLLYLPCVAKFYTQSSVCVCNVTYCDTVTRTDPKRGTYVTYTSTKAGLRFDKKSGSIGKLGSTQNNGRTVFEINRKTSYQTIEGFGGASTDTAGMNWKSLPLEAQQKLINSYFSDEGIEYNMLRLPIAASDFSSRFYTYQDQPENDLSLSNFTLAPDDYDFKIPLINAAKEVATDDIKILSTSWSPPLWMKQPMEAVGKVSVNPKYYQVFADYLCNSYFSDEGIEYNMLRLPIAASDFSSRFYTYQDQPENDLSLSNFTLAPDDYDFKIPLINAAKEVATDDIKILSTSWSPPLWMKQPMEAVGKVSVNPKYYQVFADYLCKFAEAYKENGIDIWAMTPANEPMNAILGVSFQGTLWSAPEMATFIAKFFGPTLKEKCSVKGIKLLSVDDQRSNIPFYFTLLDLFDKDALPYLDGFAVHSYIDERVPPSIVKLNMIPGKFAIASEFCAGATSRDLLKVDLGSWDRAITYFEDILENLNIDFVGWIDWNLCLDTEGGPNWVNNFVDSPIIVDAEREEFYKQPMFYALGHFSKFVPRGSKRIKIEEFGEHDSNASNRSCNQEASKKYIAFLTPRNTIVVILNNKGPARKAALRVDGTGVININLEADSFTTFEIHN